MRATAAAATAATTTRDTIAVGEIAAIPQGIVSAIPANCSSDIRARATNTKHLTDIGGTARSVDTRDWRGARNRETASNKNGITRKQQNTATTTTTSNNKWHRFASVWRDEQTTQPAATATHRASAALCVGARVSNDHISSGSHQFRKSATAQSHTRTATTWRVAPRVGGAAESTATASA